MQPLSEQQALSGTPFSGVQVTHKVLLADDDARVRSVIRFRLGYEPTFQMIGEATDLGSLLERIEATLPHILLLDLELPGLYSTTARQQLVRTLRVWVPELKVIALSSRPEARRDALLARVDAFVSKAEHPALLVQTLSAICRSA